MNPQELERLKKTKLKNMIINGHRKHLHELFVDIYGEQIYHGSVKSAAELISEDIGVKIRPFTIRGIREKKMIQNKLLEHTGNVNISFGETLLTKKDNELTLSKVTNQPEQTENSKEYDKKMEYLKNWKPIEPSESEKEVRVSGLRF